MHSHLFNTYPDSGVASTEVTLLLYSAFVKYDVKHSEEGGIL